MLPMITPEFCSPDDGKGRKIGAVVLSATAALRAPKAGGHELTEQPLRLISDLLVQRETLKSLKEIKIR